MDVENQDTHEYISHIGESRQYWRDIILGVNDGLVSIFLLVVGVVGGGLDTAQVLLTAVAGALAGAVSMAAGEYLATKSQDEILEAELALERTHIIHFKDQELEQLRGFFTDMGVDEADLDGVIAGFENNDEAILNAMAALEFGVVESERRSPYLAMAASGLLFLLGSVPSVLPFVLIPSISDYFIPLGGAFLFGAYGALLSAPATGRSRLIMAGVLFAFHGVCIIVVWSMMPL